jgi:Protein of unknown function (DUF4197)
MKILNSLLLIGLSLSTVSLKAIEIKTQVSKNGQAAVTQVMGKQNQISQEDNLNGIREALKTATSTAANKLGVENGYLGDAAVKIFLPNDAAKIKNSLNLIPGGADLMEKTIINMNCSAEDAVKKAIPIFVDAIMKMQIMDATKLVTGSDENAATKYLKQNTYKDLKMAFLPIIKESLNKPMVGNVSASQTWTQLTTKYNGIAKSPVGAVGGMKPVTTDLVDYTTDKALEGLFLKLGEQEKVIRRNPAARSSEILKKVFGQLD